MKVEIPDKLKNDIPQTLWGRILTATPVVMAVVSTMLAGLASSEMNRAQYARSLAAQQQSKAGDQWSFFQAKRLRGAVQGNSLELMKSLSVVSPFSEETLRRAADQPDSASVSGLKSRVADWLASTNSKAAIGALASGVAPRPEVEAVPEPAIQAVLHSIERGEPDTELLPLLANIRAQSVEQALSRARDQVQAYDLATKPINDGIGQLERLLAGLPPGGTGGGSVARDFAAARMMYNADRYETEARLNQAIANLYEIQVRQSNHLATRHHARSQRFFFGMLGAQLGVIISTFAIAARKRNLLWGLAAGAGLIAILFAVYVYLYV